VKKEGRNSLFLFCNRGCGLAERAVVSVKYIVDILYKEN